MSRLIDMPKLESPFEREDIKGIGYVCVPKFKQEFIWILQKDVVIATEKFDGTNVSVYVEDGNIKYIMNRTNRIDIWKNQFHFYTGIKRAIEEKKFKPEMLGDGQYFGELLGPKLQGNPYELDTPLWLPFYYVQEHFSFKFYYKWLEENFLDDTSYNDEYVFNKFSELRQNLKSLYFRKRGIEKAPEGIVFYNKLTGEMCKLRIDMFDWYTGPRHKWQEFEDKKKGDEE
jgi:hypothetical protein